MGRVGRVADGAVKGRAGIALEGLGGIKIISRHTSAGTIVRVVPESSLSVAIHTGRRSDGGIKTSIGRATRDTASSVRIISLKILLHHNISEHILIDGLTPHV